MEHRTIYDNGTYFAHNPDWHQNDSPWKAQADSEVIRRNSLQITRLAEVGCGAGKVIATVAEHIPGVEATGYDISPEAIAMCAPQERSRVTYLLEDLTTSHRFYDLLLVIDVFEHVEDPFNFLRRLKHKATYKVLHIPLDISVQSVLRVRPIVKSWEKIGHLHFYTPETALATLRHVGYEVLDWSYTHHRLELPNRSIRTRILGIPRWLGLMVNEHWTVRVLGGSSMIVPGNMNMPNSASGGQHRHSAFGLRVVYGGQTRNPACPAMRMSAKGSTQVFAMRHCLSTTRRHCGLVVEQRSIGPKSLCRP